MWRAISSRYPLSVSTRPTPECMALSRVYLRLCIHKISSRRLFISSGGLARHSRWPSHITSNYSSRSVRTLSIVRPSIMSPRDFSSSVTGDSKRYTVSSADHEDEMLTSRNQSPTKNRFKSYTNSISSSEDDIDMLGSDTDIEDCDTSSSDETSSSSDSDLSSSDLSSSDLSDSDLSDSEISDLSSSSDTDDAHDTDGASRRLHNADLPDWQLEQDNFTDKDKPTTVNLSDFPRSEDGGIIIHSDVSFDRNESPGSSADTYKHKGYDLQSLLHNIQRSRAEKASAAVREERTDMMSIEELVEFLREQNARDVLVIELPPELDYAKYFVICSGVGSRHISRMADSLVSELRKLRIGRKGRKVRVEGRDCEDWMAVDLSEIVVHFMLTATREKYELEKLWTLGEVYDDQCRALRLLQDTPSQ